MSEGILLLWEELPPRAQKQLPICGWAWGCKEARQGTSSCLSYLSLSLSMSLPVSVRSTWPQWPMCMFVSRSFQKHLSIKNKEKQEEVEGTGLFSAKASQTLLGTGVQVSGNNNS